MSVKNEQVSKGAAKNAPSKSVKVPASDAVDDAATTKEVKSKEDLSDVVAFKSLTANKLSLRSKGLLS